MRPLGKPTAWHCRECGGGFLALGPAPEPPLCDACAPPTVVAGGRRAFTADELAARRARLPELLAAAEVPERYRGCTRATWSDQVLPWPNAVADWCGVRSVYAYGATPGTGKTHLVTALLAERLVAGAGGLWLDTGDLLHRLRRGFGSGGGGGAGGDDTLLDRCLDADVLVLDDLGAEALTLWGATQVAFVLRQRFNHRRPVLVTSNLKLSRIGLADPGGDGRGGGGRSSGSRGAGSLVPDPRIVSRLLSDAILVHLHGTDQRLEGRP